MVGPFLPLFLVFIYFTFLIIFVLANFVFFCRQENWQTLISVKGILVFLLKCFAFVLSYLCISYFCISHLCNVYVCILQTKKAGRGQCVCGGPSAFMGSGTASRGGGGGRRGPPLKTNR